MPETLAEKQIPPTCIDLETALRSIHPDDADLCWEVNEDDIRTCDSPDKVFSEIVLEKCLLQAEKENEQKREQEERGKQEALKKQLEKDKENTRKNTKLPPSGLTYKPLTADEMTAASEGLEPILYTGVGRSQVYYNAHQKRKGPSASSSIGSEKKCKKAGKKRVFRL